MPFFDNGYVAVHNARAGHGIAPYLDGKIYPVLFKRGLVQAKVDEDLGTAAKIPIVGTVAAGVPILTEENIDGFITLDQSALKKNRTYFAVKVRGDSMSGAGIMDGDLAVIEKRHIVENGEIALAAVDDAFTLKRFYKIENHRVKLVAENPKYKPIIKTGEHVRLEGRLVEIVRHYK